MDVAGDALLAGAGLAEQQDGGVARGDTGGEVEGRRAVRIAAGRAASGAEQLGGQGVAEGEVGVAKGQAGRRGQRRAGEGGGVRAIIEDQVIGRGAGLLVRREDGEALVPAVLRGEDRGRKAGAGQEACQRRICPRDLFAHADHHTPGIRFDPAGARAVPDCAAASSLCGTVGSGASGRRRIGAARQKNVALNFAD